MYFSNNDHHPNAGQGIITVASKYNQETDYFERRTKESCKSVEK